MHFCQLVPKASHEQRKHFIHSFMLQDFSSSMFLLIDDLIKMAHISHHYLLAPFLMKNILNNGKIWHMVRNCIYYVSTIDFFIMCFYKDIIYKTWPVI